MKIQSTGAAVAAAMAGAAGWAALLVTMEREMDLLAVVVGALIGLSAMKLGARSNADAAICALLAVAALLGGKAIGAHLLFKEQLPIAIEGLLSQDTFAEEIRAAKQLGTLKGEALRPFMAEWGHSDSEEAAGVTDAELATFEREEAPRLRWVAQSAPTYEAWQERASGELHAVLSAVPFLTVVRVATDSESLDDLLFDLLFVLLGAGAAAEIVRRAGKEDSPAEFG